MFPPELLMLNLDGVSHKLLLEKEFKSFNSCFNSCIVLEILIKLVLLSYPSD